MITYTKKFFFALLVIVLLFGLIFYKQLRKSLSIVVQPETTPLIALETTYFLPDDFLPILGNPGAPTTIVLFGDFSCDKCKKALSTLTDFTGKNPTKVRLIWEGVPMKKWYATENPLPHQAVYCAGKQNLYWQFLEASMKNSNSLTENGLKKIAEELKLDTAVWWQCLNSNDSKAAVASTTLTAVKANVGDVPALFINNYQVNLVDDVDLNDLLKKFVIE